jgi:ribonuclease P protein component
MDASLSTVELAFAIPRPVGSAVVRNRLRRRIRSIVSSLFASGEISGAQVLVICRPAAAELSFSELSETVTELVRRHGRRAS